MENYFLQKIKAEEKTNLNEKKEIKNENKEIKSENYIKNDFIKFEMENEEINIENSNQQLINYSNIQNSEQYNENLFKLMQENKNYDIYNQKNNIDVNNNNNNYFHSQLIEEFFLSLQNNFVLILGPIKADNLIQQLITDDKKDVNFLLNELSKKLIEICEKSKNLSLETLSKSKINLDENNENNYNYNRLRKGKIKVKPEFNFDEAIVEDNSHCELTLSDLDMSLSQKKIFEEILDKLQLKNSVNKIMHQREMNKIKKVFKVSNQKGLIIHIPQGKIEYKYRFIANKERPSFYLKCLDPRCKGKGRINKFDFTFKLDQPHNIDHSI